jgi:hypothetical protein
MEWINTTVSYKLYKIGSFVQKIINEKIIKHKPLDDGDTITKPCGYKTIVACEKPSYNELFNSQKNNNKLYR